MKNLIALSILILLLSGCTWQTTVELSAGKQIDTAKVIYTDGFVCQFELRHESEAGLFVSVRHNSSCTSGWPFNNKKETWTDTVSAGKVWVLRRGAEK
jgi:hypothetical protein